MVFSYKLVRKIKFPDALLTIYNMKENPQMDMLDILIRRGRFGKKEWITIPEAAIIGLRSRFNLTKKKVYYCSHSYTSNGNPVTLEEDPINQLSRILEETERDNKMLWGIIQQLRQTVNELNQTSDESVKKYIAVLGEIVEKAVVPARQKSSGKGETVFIEGPSQSSFGGQQ